MEDQEQKKYHSNIEQFEKEILRNHIDHVSFVLDKEPTFDLNNVPFRFSYAHSITIHCTNENYLIHSSQTSRAVDTLWIEKIEKDECVKEGDLIKGIDEPVLKLQSKIGYDQFCFKIKIETKNHFIIFYAAEIYDQPNGTLDYKMNDEMILAFDDLRESDIFENKLKAASKTKTVNPQRNHNQNR